MMANQNKKYKNLSIKQKLEAIHEVEKGRSISNVAKEMNIARTTLSGFMKNKEKIIQASEFGSLERKRINKIPKLDEALFRVFNITKNTNISINGPVIQETAKVIAKRIEGFENFKGSNGWLERYKKRNGIAFRKTKINYSGSQLNDDHHEPSMEIDSNSKIENDSELIEINTNLVLGASEETNEEPSISGIEEPQQNDSNYSQVPLDNSDNYEIKSEKSLSINECDENDTCDNNSNFTESPLRQLLQNHRLYPVLSQFLNARSIAEQISLQQQQQQNRVNSSPPPLNFLRPQSIDETNSPSPSVPNQAEFNNTTKKKIKTIPGEKEETKNLTNKQLERMALIEHIEFTKIQKEYYSEKLKLLKN